MADPLYMLQLDLDTPRLAQLSTMLHLPDSTDMGYLVHCALGELFQHQAPSPFLLQSRSQDTLHVLAYSPLPEDALIAIAQGFASPHVYSILRGCLSKPMPLQYSEGMRLGFTLRACPVVRTSRDSPHHKKGAELDAYLAHIEQDPDSTHTREHVYLNWLARQLEHRRGATLISSRMTSFELTPLIRRDHGPKRKNTRLPRRPVITVEGVIEVNNSDDFRKLLASGIGRHSSFGFGMLLVRRATRLS